MALLWIGKDIRKKCSITELLYKLQHYENVATKCLLHTAEEKSETNDGEPLWKNPEKHALPNEEKTYTNFKEAKVDWSYVKRLLPIKVIPEPPKYAGVSPSGWLPPRDPLPNLPYYIKRSANHLPALFLERRRDELNPKTMDFEYVELVTIKNIFGDVFACEKDLRKFLELEVRHPIATHVDELKGFIKVKGADRTLIEKFIFATGF